MWPDRRFRDTWYMQPAAGDIPNGWDIVLILVIGQHTKQHTNFVCRQVPFLWWGGSVVSVHRKVAFFVLGLVSECHWYSQLK